MYYLSPYVRLLDKRFYWRCFNTSDKIDMVIYTMLIVAIGIKATYIVLDVLKERYKK